MSEAGISVGFWAASLLLAALAVAATRLLAASVLPQMERAGFVASNYRGRRLPKAGGAVPALVAGAGLLFWLALPWESAGALTGYAARLLPALFGFALVGLVDDAAGDRSAGGLGGHWRRLLRGELTTGGLKAAFGILTALAVTAAASSSILEWFLNGFVLAGLANGINLLDVRPGRALKGFFVTAAALWALSRHHPAWIVVAPAFAAFAAFAPDDLSGRAMLGDGGANSAGALLGMAAVLTSGLLVKAALGLAVAALHGAAERGSITALVENTPLLRRIDEWGRTDRG